MIFGRKKKKQTYGDKVQIGLKWVLSNKLDKVLLSSLHFPFLFSKKKNWLVSLLERRRKKKE